MRRAVRLGLGAVVTILVSELSACALTTDLDGLSGGAPAALDGPAALDSPATEASGLDGASPNDGSSSSRYEMAVLADTPVAYFKFDEAAGPTATDRMGGAPGTYSTSGVTYAQSGAIAGNAAIALDGTSGRISLGARFPFTGSAAFSFELWVKPSVVDASVRWLFQRGTADPGNPNSYGLLVYTPKTLFQRLTPGGDTYASTAPLGTASFTHIVVTFDGARNSMYFGGILTSMGAGADGGTVTDVPGSELVIGDSAGPRPNKFAGIVDEVAIYDKVLSPQRVLAHFTAAQP